LGLSFDILSNMSRYPWPLPMQLATHIETYNIVAAHQHLDRLLDIISEHPSARLDVRKLRCSQLAHISLRGALRGGADSEISLREHIEILEALAMGRTWNTVKLLMHDYVSQLLERVCPERHTDMERLVAWMREDMGASLAKPKTLSYYAQSGDVSLAHLSRCFLAINGCTFREEMKRLRMEKARSLLEESSLKVRAIATRVGMRDTGRFISEFRRASGVTPGAYRQSHRKASAHTSATAFERIET
jgi:two-component system response regulator YesN